MAKSTCSTTSNSSCSSNYSTGRSSADSNSARSDLGLKLSSNNGVDRRKRLAANARERKRMHLLNQAYDRLRKRLVDAENKSKYDVLVQAKEYIQALATICEKLEAKEETNTVQPSLPQSSISSNQETKSTPSIFSGIGSPAPVSYIETPLQQELSINHEYHQYQPSPSITASSYHNSYPSPINMSTQLQIGIANQINCSTDHRMYPHDRIKLETL